jgi:hypothetical protein
MDLNHRMMESEEAATSSPCARKLKDFNTVCLVAVHSQTEPERIPKPSPTSLRTELAKMKNRFGFSLPNAECVPMLL